MKILMVCLGNICRSPIAEGLLQSKIEQKNLNWVVDSAATSNWHTGKSPDGRAQAVARKHGLNISNQRARQLRKEDFENYDLILAMDASNYQNIIKLADNEQHRKKVKPILSFTKHPDKDVPDPYFDDNGFEYVYELLDQACEQIVLSA